MRLGFRKLTSRDTGSASRLAVYQSEKAGLARHPYAKALDMRHVLLKFLHISKFTIFHAHLGPENFEVQMANDPRTT